jgi:dCTP deaminase
MILSKRQLQSGFKYIIPDPVAYSATGADLTLGAELDVWDRYSGQNIWPSRPGYDANFTLKKYTHPFNIKPGEGFVLQPGAFVLGWTAETIRLSDKMAACVEGKSGLARLGLVVHMTAPTIHAGFGPAPIRLEIANHGTIAIGLEVGMAICQIILEQVLV